MTTEQEIEQEIQQKGLTAPRLTPEWIDSQIKSEAYYEAFETTTVCVLELVNGYTVVGKSACASPENFDAELGMKIAREDARREIWKLEGYLLKQRIYEGANNA